MELEVGHGSGFKEEEQDSEVNDMSLVKRPRPAGPNTPANHI